MIISNLSAPYKSLYVIGANILTILQSNVKKTIDPLELFDEFKVTNQNISIAYFNFGLDWLYMTGSIELTELGDVKLCS
jgi:hypothetical protein